MFNLGNVCLIYAQNYCYSWIYHLKWKHIYPSTYSKSLTHTVQANAQKQFTFYGCINVCEMENVCDFLHALIRCVKIITSIERKSLGIDHIFAR